MIRNLLVLLSLVAALWANAITYTYGEFNSKAKTCTLTGWGGQQPTSGKLVLKETYEKDGVTYKVTAIAPHALDNLTTVTEITIPANVVKIGEIYDGFIDETKNFFNCPKLALFKVASGSATFAATGAGLLMYKGGTTIVRVPQAIAFSSGTTLKMSKSVEVICRDAFAGNTTITNIALSPNVSLFSEGCGFSDMKSLKEFSVNGTETPAGFTVVDGVLYEADKKSLISFPPCKLSFSFTVPSTVEEIGKKAFRNTGNLYEINLYNVKTIRKEAFANSGVTKLTIPGGVKKIEDGAFRGLVRLQEMTIEPRLRLPANFARDSRLLAKVNLPQGAEYLDHNAFKDCLRLEQFPFTAEISYEGDSIFSGCGFKNVFFQPGAMPEDGLDIGEAIFAGNKELTMVDMSRLEVGEKGFGTDVPLSFVADCPKLNMVILPKVASFWGATERPAYNFGVNSPVYHIAMGAFNLSGSPALFYDSGTHTPQIYMQTTDAPLESWPLKDFFGVSGGAICKPSIYCEGYTMVHDWSATEYICPWATYYVPGGTTANYAGAADEGCHVFEMYQIEALNEDGKLKLLLTDRVDGLVFTGVYANGDISLGVPDSAGKLATDIAYSGVDKLTVEYNLRGMTMKTVYPELPGKSGVDKVDVDGSMVAIRLAGSVVDFGMEADYSVVDIAGRIVMTGTSSSADLSPLRGGVYVVSARGGDDMTVVKKISID